MSQAMAEAGLVVCTRIDLSKSWFQMIYEEGFRKVVVEPVRTTFSPAQNLASSSYSNHLGFNRLDRKTCIGNLIAFRCLAILWFSYKYGELGLLEQPRLSKMAWVSIWRFLLRLGFSEASIGSCMFGSPHRKPFRLLGHGMDFESLNVRFSGGHQHVRSEGRFAKQSAVYCLRPAAHLAKVIAAGLDKGKGLVLSQRNHGLKVSSWTISEGWIEG